MKRRGFGKWLGYLIAFAVGAFWGSSKSGSQTIAKVTGKNNDTGTA